MLVNVNQIYKGSGKIQKREASFLKLTVQGNNLAAFNAFLIGPLSISRVDPFQVKHSGILTHVQFYLSVAGKIDQVPTRKRVGKGKMELVRLYLGGRRVSKTN